MACASTSQCWAVGYYVSGNGKQTLIEGYTPTIPPLTGVASSMRHGSAGSFDINLPLTGTRGVECRSGVGGVNGNYSIVFSFVNTLQSVGPVSVSSGTGTVSTSALGPNPNQYTVNLTGVTNKQYLTIALTNVLDSQSNTGNVSGTMGLLLGDTTGDGAVNVSDIAQTKSKSGQVVTASNFRNDVTVDGAINSSDIALVKSKSGSAISP